MIHASLGGRLPVLQLLAGDGADLNRGDNLGSTVLHDAVRFNVHDSLRFHLQSGVNVYQKLRNGKSILHVLAEVGDQTTMQIFLESAQNGVDRLNVDDTDDRGRTAMEYLGRRRDPDEVFELFQLVLQRVLVAKFHCLGKLEEVRLSGMLSRGRS